MGPVLITIWMLVALPAGLVAAGYVGSLLLDFAMRRAQAASAVDTGDSGDEATG